MNQPTAQGKGGLESLLTSIDEGIQDHLAWNQQLMRCALLHQSPGEDMLQPNAHQLCRFGRWLLEARIALQEFDAALTDELERQHKAMHDAVRALCEHSRHGLAASAEDFQAYERGQTAMVQCLNTLRLRVADSMLQHDALTGLPLRNGLDYAFQIRRRDARRDGLPLHLAMVDMDHFKRINDTWGHSVGDRALQHVARLMTACLRENDIVIRYGGEEFLLLLLGQEVEEVVRRLMAEVRRHPLPLDDGQTLSLQVTVGLTRVTPADTLDRAIDRADHALLQGKREGRDRYVMADAARG